MSAIKDGGQAYPHFELHHDHMPMLPVAGMTLRQAYKIAALQAILPTEVVASTVPALANAIGRDVEWRTEIIAAVSKSAGEIADAMLAEDAEHARKSKL